MKKKVLLYLTSFLFFFSISETCSACWGNSENTIFPHADVELIGFSSNNNAFALRYAYFDENQLKSSCNYPKIKGKSPSQVVYYLNQTGKGESNWIIYKDIVADYDIGQTAEADYNADKKSCTAPAVSSRKLEEAEKAFDGAGIDKILQGVPIFIKSKKDKNDRPLSFITLSRDIMNRFSFDEIKLEDDVFLKIEDDIVFHYGLVATAAGYDPLVLLSWDNRVGPEQHSIQNAWLSPGSNSVIIIFSVCGVTSRPFVVSLPNLSAQMLNNKGLALHKKKLYDQSEKLFFQAWQTDGSYYRALFNLACAQAMLNKKTEAINSLKELINREKSYTNLIRKDKDLDSLRNDAKFQALFQ